MPSIRGEAVKSFQISTDDTTGNLKELKSDLLQTLSYGPGVVAEQRTRGDDAVRRYERLKPDPSIEVVFDPEMATDRAYALIMLTTADAQAFDLKIATSVSTEGLHISGKCLVTEPTGTYESGSGEANVRAILRPVGEEWTFDTDVS